MISYFELLGMIKEDKAPRKIRVHLTSNPKIYKAVYDFGDFNYYTLYEEEIIDDDYHHYLAECFLESSMFDKNIEILDKKKIPDKLKSLNNVGNVPNLLEFADKQQLNNCLLKDKLNEVIHYLQYLKSKGE